MGLDVYLTRYADREKAKRLEAEYEKRTEGFWSDEGVYGELARAELAQMTDEEKAEHERALVERNAKEHPMFRRDKMSIHDLLPEDRRTRVRDEIKRREKEIQTELGVGEYGDGGEEILLDSKIHPNHYFKIGYLRSSYNEGGINSVLRTQLGGKDLYYIFDPHDEYEFRPDWKGALARAQEVRDEYEAQVLNWPFQAAEFDPNVFSPEQVYEVRSAEQARAIVQAEIERSVSRDKADREEWARREQERIAKALSSGDETDPEALKPRPYKPFFGSAYSNRSGEFFLGAPKKWAAGIGLMAAIIGVDEKTDRRMPVLYVARRTSPDGYDFEILTLPMGKVARSKEHALDVFRKAWLKAEKDRQESGGAALVRAGNGAGAVYYFPDDPVAFRMADVKPKGEDDEDGDGKGGLNVFAIIPGATNSLGQIRPAWYAIYHAPGLYWYLSALEVTIEMCEYVLAQENPNEFWLRWSS